MVKKRNERSSQSQSSMSFLVMTGVIIAVIIPVLFYSGSILDTRPGVMSRNLDVIKETVVSLSHLGVRNSDTVYITTPKGVLNAQWEPNSCTPGGDAEICTSKCTSIRVDYEDGQREYLTVDYPMCGSLWWMHEAGNYYVTLYNDGNNIVFLHCGDGVVTGYEQCEYCEENSDCASDRCDKNSNVCRPPPGTGPNYCNRNGYTGDACVPAGNAFGCFCQCTDDSQCPGVCDLKNGVCGPCIDNSQCPDGSYCDAGACHDCDRDGDGYNGTINSNCQGPLDCDDNALDDEPFCNGVNENNCLNNPNQFGVCAFCINPGPLVVEVCDDGVDNECDGLVDCLDPDCTGHASCSGSCGDGSIDSGEECDGNDLSGCDIGEVCVPAGNPNECTCTFCGNNILDGNEECEDDSQCGGGEFCLPPGDPNECTCFGSSSCGDGTCDAGETVCDCPADCVDGVDDVCGDACVSGSESCESNAHCLPGEVCFGCSCEPESDECGDGVCDPAKFENCATCLADCQCDVGYECNPGSGTCEVYGGDQCTQCCGQQECGYDTCCGLSCGFCGPTDVCDGFRCVPIPVCGNGQWEFGEECEVDTDCPPIIGFKESCSAQCSCEYTPTGPPPPPDKV